jgi:long-chain acyl-CoA synthetase
VIITAGENIYPREIEEVSYAHPRIQEAVVLGVAHEGRRAGGEGVHRAARGRDLDPTRYPDLLRRATGDYKVPRQIEFRESLPKTLTGKILRRVLLEEEAARPKRRRRGGQGAGEGVEGTV